MLRLEHRFVRGTPRARWCRQVRRRQAAHRRGRRSHPARSTEYCPAPAARSPRRTISMPCARTRRPRPSLPLLACAGIHADSWIRFRPAANTSVSGLKTV